MSSKTKRPLSPDPADGDRPIKKRPVADTSINFGRTSLRSYGKSGPSSDNTRLPQRKEQHELARKAKARTTHQAAETLAELVPEVAPAYERQPVAERAPMPVLADAPEPAPEPAPATEASLGPQPARTVLLLLSAPAVQPAPEPAPEPAQAAEPSTRLHPAPDLLLLLPTPGVQPAPEPVPEHAPAAEPTPGLQSAPAPIVHLLAPAVQHAPEPAPEPAPADESSLRLQPAAGPLLLLPAAAVPPAPEPEPDVEAQLAIDFILLELEGVLGSALEESPVSGPSAEPEPQAGQESTPAPAGPAGPETTFESGPSLQPVSAPQPEPDPERECTICAEILSLSRYPSKPPTARCEHELTACSSCMEQHISAEINAIKCSGFTIDCPEIDCAQRLQYDEVQLLATPATFERYDTLLLRKQLQTDPDFIWCKRADCGSGQIHDGGGDANIVTCTACNTKSCFTHDVPWHDGVTCEDYDRILLNNKNDAASKTYCEQKTKPCPQCKVRIEKHTGCDHMTCRRPGGCGHEFCWLCLADYNLIRREGNQRHQTTCQYYVVYIPLPLPRLPYENFEPATP